MPAGCRCGSASTADTCSRGDFGPTFRRTYSVKGDAVNLAARVMGKAPSGGVMATEAVLERVRRQVRAREVPPFMVKGVNRPIQASLVDFVGRHGEGGSTPPRRRGRGDPRT